jgi:hypothetical protein
MLCLDTIYQFWKVTLSIISNVGLHTSLIWNKINLFAEMFNVSNINQYICVLHLNGANVFFKKLFNDPKIVIFCWKM